MALLNTNIGPERVQVFDVPVGAVQIAGSATSVCAFLISTAKVGAPLNTPTRVQTFEEFVDLFGDADDISYDGYYAVKGFYDNAGSGADAVIVHVGTSPTANSFIGNASLGTGLRALDTVDDIGLVCIPGLPLSMAHLVHGPLIDYSETVRAEFGATLSTMYSLLSVPKEITKANTDVQLLGPLTVSSVTGLVVGFSGSPVLAPITPGMIVKKAGAYVGKITAVNDSTDELTLSSVGTIAVSDANITVHMPSAVTYKDSVVNNPSRVAAWYFNPPLMVDESSTATPGDVVTVDPVGQVAGVMARIDANIAIGGVSHAPAGIQFAGLAGILGLSLSISERIDAEPLRLAFINRITSFPGAGNIIFGGYSAGGPAVTADEQLIQVMRALQYIKSSLEKGLRGFLWENFSPETQSQVERAIESFMRNNIHLFPAGLPESQQFRVLRVEPTQDELDQGLLRVRVLVKPNKAVRFIEVALEFPLPTA
jgi:phage tail sheath protein FI